MLNRMTTLRLSFLLVLAALALAVGAYVLMSGGEVQAHGCGHTQFHQNHSGVTGDHASTLTFAADHGHSHRERAVSYTWYNYTAQTSGHGQPPAGADGWHLHCLIIGGI